MTRIFSIASLFLLAAAQASLAAGPRVDIVIGEKAPALEKRAAEDVAADLKQIYDSTAKILTSPSDESQNVIFVGNRNSFPDIKDQIPLNPRLGDRARLHTVRFRGRSALYIGGGDPLEVYYAAADYSRRLGIRPLLSGDLYPVSPQPFTLEQIESFAAPDHKYRSWSLSNSFPLGSATWSLNDIRRLLRQVSRLKYNQVVIDLRAWQPFIHFEYEGTSKKTGVFGQVGDLFVSGDTAGRSAFKGSKLFENPDFHGLASYEERLAAGQKYLRGVCAESHAVGMSVVFQVDPFEFPREFEPYLSKSKQPTKAEGLAITVAGDDVNEKALMLAKRQLRAYIETYPDFEFLAIRTNRQGDAVARIEQDRELGRRGEKKWVSISSIDPEPRILPKRDFTLVRDLDYDAYRTSLMDFDPRKEEDICANFVNPICGDGVHLSVLKAHEQIHRAQALIDESGGFQGDIRDFVLKHYASADPPPQWWSKVRDNYLGAMNDMYRANSRAREGGRSYTLYLARRCEFGYEYINCVEATRLAGVAKGKKDTAEQRAQLEKAIESMNAACSALAAVARDQSDRGMIAVCNEFGYKALQKELEKLDGEEGK
ncbi:MAG: hypothetical protein K8R36_14105 [Planctomycetales bacterium]|nr:hypothetical protein [Planctomycetales bacterium]